MLPGSCGPGFWEAMMARRLVRPIHVQRIVISINAALILRHQSIITKNSAYLHDRYRWLEKP
jgi:hypothetical protein